MRIALIVGNNIWFCPYVKIYTDVLDKLKIEYDIISWNRDGKENNQTQFNCIMDKQPALYKFIAHMKYILFVKKSIRRNKYDKLIVLSPNVAIFLNNFLYRYYKERYIFDFRDLSIEQKSIFKCPFLNVLKYSYANVISSPGFTKYLPSGFKYYLSHNFNIDVVRKALSNDEEVELPTDNIDILTIGGIRDYESNVQLIDSLSNIEGFTLRFVGKGPSATALKEHAEEIKAANISFEGYYPKEKEADYIENSTFLNIFYPRKPSHDSALSNRFYNSLIFRKPMITTADTTQGDYAANYGVGVALKDCRNITLDLRTFLKSVDSKTYVENCNKLLSDFMADYESWEKMVNSFVD